MGNNTDLDRSQILINELNHTIVNIYKVCMEEMGYDMGVTENFTEYHNYLINTPLSIGNGSLNNLGDLGLSSGFVDYNGPADGSIGSSSFPQGKGKGMDPNGIYWPFNVFGFGASPKKRPGAAYSQRSGVECCKLAVNTIFGYLKSGCRTIGDVIAMYHGGQPSYEKFLQFYNKNGGTYDIMDSKTWRTAQDMITRQNYYRQNVVNYTHLSIDTPISRSYRILFPLITFISRQEQGVNCEAACKIALKEMGIT